MEEVRIEKKEAECEIAEPSIAYKDSFLAAQEESKERGTNFAQAVEEIRNNFAGYIKHLKEESEGINLRPGRVPQTTFWVIDKDGYAGRISIRHSLNELLLKVGGHIGYEIRPSKRRLGYGEKALKLALPKAKALGLDRVLLTCDSTNVGSRKIIEANGGVLENEIPGEEGKPSKLRFWINLSS
jgi:predicted acetyltransferase